MREPDRLDRLYEYLKDIHKQNFPDWRFFQLVYNFLSWYGQDPFFIEDDKVYELVDKFVKGEKLNG